MTRGRDREALKTETVRTGKRNHVGLHGHRGNRRSKVFEIHWEISVRIAKERIQDFNFVSAAENALNFSETKMILTGKCHSYRERHCRRVKSGDRGNGFAKTMTDY